MRGAGRNAGVSRRLVLSDGRPEQQAQAQRSMLVRPQARRAVHVVRVPHEFALVKRLSQQDLPLARRRRQIQGNYLSIVIH